MTATLRISSSVFFQTPPLTITFLAVTYSTYIFSRNVCGSRASSDKGRVEKMSMPTSMDQTQKAVPLLDDMDESLFDHEKEISQNSSNKFNNMISPVRSLGKLYS